MRAAMRQAQDEGRTASAEWRAGWPVVLSASVGYGTGGALMMNVLGLFILPMRTELGWSTTAVTIAPLVSLVWALSSPLVGRLIDRIGSRRSAIYGSLGLAVCVALLGVVPVGPAMFYAIAVAMGVCCSIVAVPTYTRAVATWFRGSVGLAFGITLSGSALVAVVAMPLVGGVIAGHGWRAGFLAVSAVIIGLGLSAIALGFRERPVPAPASGETRAAGQGVDFARALSDVRFWLYAAAFGSACIAIGGFVGHLQPLLGTAGFPVATAVALGVLYSVSTSLGRIGGGFLLDRCSPFAVAAGFLLLAAAGALAMPFVGPGMSLLAPALLVLLLGMGHGAEADFLAFFGLRSFGMAAYSSVLGALAMVSSIAVSFGIFLFAWMADVLGGYEPACFIGAAAFAVAALLILAAGLVEGRDAEPPAGKEGVRCNM